jgi:hypothetical protein
VVHLATTLEIQAVGVNLSARQIAAARERWADVANLELIEDEALRYLTKETDCFDAMYSVNRHDDRARYSWTTSPSPGIPCSNCLSPPEADGSGGRY